MTTMMTAPAGAEPDAVTLQIPAIPMTWEQASIMLDATFDAWRMLSGEIDCFASMFVRQVRQCFSVVWADGFPRCRHRFPVM